MDPMTLLAEAVAAGLTVRIDGDRLVIRGPKTAGAVARRLLEYKPEVTRERRTRRMSTETTEAPALTIDDEFRAAIPPLTADELGELEASVVAEGCRDALIVWSETGVLLDGHHRLDICTRHGLRFKTVALEFPDRAAAKAWLIRNQLARRNLTPYQRAELALALEPLIRQKAKENQRQAGGAIPPTLAEPVETRRVLARIAGISHGTLDKVRAITTRAPEAVKERLRRGETTINKEFKVVVQAARKAEQIRAVETTPLPQGKYHVLVVDPPWCYRKRPGDATNRAACPYPSMSVDEIKAIGIGDLAQEDCILWLWATNAHMREAHEVAEAWGFEVKTILTWAKDRMGCGDWLRGRTEHCLLCVSGKPVVRLTNETTLLEAPVRQHSRKPEEFYALVEHLCPGRRCELFARQRREGWDCFGAEVGKFAADLHPPEAARNATSRSKTESD